MVKIFIKTTDAVMTRAGASVGVHTCIAEFHTQAEADFAFECLLSVRGCSPVKLYRTLGGS